jgi:hypothetical protein
VYIDTGALSEPIVIGEFSFYICVEKVSFNRTAKIAVAYRVSRKENPELAVIRGMSIGGDLVDGQHLPLPEATPVITLK